MRAENEERQRKAEEEAKTTTTTTTTTTAPTTPGATVTPRVIFKTVRDEEMEKELAILKKKNQVLERSRVKQIKQLERVHKEKESAQKVIDELAKEKARLKGKLDQVKEKKKEEEKKKKKEEEQEAEEEEEEVIVPVAVDTPKQSAPVRANPATTAEPPAVKGFVAGEEKKEGG